MSSQYNVSLTATESTKTNPLITDISLRLPGEHKLQATSNGRDVCTMFNGNPFYVRCSADEHEVEGRCIKRPSCDHTVQLDIDGRCVNPQASAAFALDELRVDVFKPADGVVVPPAGPYIISVSPAVESCR
jgi:hypothetical protein